MAIPHEGGEDTFIQKNRDGQELRYAWGHGRVRYIPTGLPAVGTLADGGRAAMGGGRFCMGIDTGQARCYVSRRMRTAIFAIEKKLNRGETWIIHCLHIGYFPTVEPSSSNYECYERRIHLHISAKKISSG